MRLSAELGGGHDRADTELHEQVRAATADDGPDRRLVLSCLDGNSRKRPATRRNASTMVSSTSQKGWTHRLAAVVSIPGSFWPRNRSRRGTGAQITRLNTRCWAGSGVDRGAGGRQLHREPPMFPTAVNGDGYRELLAVATSTSESGPGWSSFFKDLVARGLSGVALVTSDAHPGLVSAIGLTCSARLGHDAGSTTRST